MPKHFGYWWHGTKTETIAHALAGANCNMFDIEVGDLIYSYEKEEKFIYCIFRTLLTRNIERENTYCVSGCFPHIQR